MALTVSVPASSANLGPGFDCFAAALDLHLELTVSDADAFELETDLPVARDRSNLLVRAFETLHPADGLRFEVRSQIPLAGGLGSSAAAVLAGLLAADRLHGGGADVLALASALEGHPDNVAAALRGGIVIATDGAVARFEAPNGLALFAVVPGEAVTTAAARAALPASVPLADAVHNAAHAGLLVLALLCADWELLARALRDRLHEPYRASLYPRSAALLRDARGLGALGATLSGAGPSVLVWARSTDAAALAPALEGYTRGWASVIGCAVSAAGARVGG